MASMVADARRTLMLATFVNTFGNGAYLSTSAIFLTRSVGLHPAELALGLSAATLVAIALTQPAGHLCDRYGPKRVQLTALLALAVGYTAMTQVHHAWQFVGVAAVNAGADAAVRVSLGALVAAAVPATERVRMRALVRSTNNAGIALGTLAGAVPLALDTRAGYVAVLLVNAVSFLLTASVVSRVPAGAPVRRPPGESRFAALRDKPFAAYVLIDGLVAAIYNDLLGLALPLWLARYTHAPLTLVTVALLVNTVGCVTLQVWVSRGVHTAREAIPANRRGALVLSASCVLFALTYHRSGVLAVVILVAAATVHVLGELQSSAATFAVVFDLAPDWAHGQYQAAQQTGRQIGNLIAPPLLTGLVIGLGAPGWAAVAGILGLAGILSPRAIRRGLEQRAPATAMPGA
jgi:MFS family permease